MKRRNFLLTSMAGAATAALAPSTVLASCAPKKDGKKANTTPLNLCFQEGIALGATLQEKLDYCESLGVTGFEVGGRG
ncbi:MAG: sugar phosphate isomerase/epimerase, partial [Bacteroidaceae bacterium]|nr:sugar phosphate isomerase/epimerase [Bacteroidaceae bacterium]